MLDDIEALAFPVLRHRLAPTFAAEAEGIAVDDLIKKLVVAAKDPHHARVIYSFYWRPVFSLGV